MLKSLHLTLLGMALLFTTPGCGLVSEPLESNEMAVALLIQSPAVPNPDKPGETLPQATSLVVSVADVNVTALNTGGAGQAATPNDSATVSVQFTNTTTNQPVTLSVPSAGAGTGSYTLTSVTSSQLVYEVGQLYTVSISYGGKLYELSVSPPPAIAIQEFQPPTVTNDTINGWATGTPFTITRDPTNSNVAFYEVATITSSGSLMQVATNAPQTPSDFLTLITSPGTFETPTFTIPGSDLSAASTPYVITLTSLADGQQVSGSTISSLFTGSTFFAGASAGGVLVTAQ